MNRRKAAKITLLSAGAIVASLFLNMAAFVPLILTATVERLIKP